MNTDSHRYLEDAEAEIVDSLSTVKVIEGSMQVYGSIFSVMFLIYIFIRPKFPLTYNLSNSIQPDASPLSNNHYGHVRWIRKVFTFSDEEILEYCGMDAICFLRILRFGLKVALVGVFNSMFLIPVNMYGCISDSQGNSTSNNSTSVDSCTLIKDRIEETGLGNVAASSSSLLATTFAAYILFGSAMYLILEEFKWFTDARHKFLARHRPDNYTVYVSNIPPEYRTNHSLAKYFRRVFSSHESVVDARVALDVPNLKKKVVEREVLVNKLEHAINVRNVKGVTPKHRTKTCCGQKVDSIITYTEKLNVLNDEISTSIFRIEGKNNSEPFDEEERGVAASSSRNSATRKDSDFDQQSIQIDTAILESESNESERSFITESDRNNNAKQSSLFLQDSGLRAKKSRNMFSPYGKLKSKVKGIKTIAAKSAGIATKTSIGLVSSLLEGGQEVTYRDAGFVSFSSLMAKSQTLQMIHHKVPFTFTVLEAPLPKDVFWDNVGLPHKEVQLGYLLAQVLTILLCVFWTIPVAFLTSLAEVDELKKRFGFLQDWTEELPWLEMFLAQLKPLTIIIIVHSLPLILGKFCKYEGHIAETALQASLFVKLSVFLIVQVFFVQAVSGSIMSEIDAIINDPKQLINLLATSIPAQVQAFTQYIIVQTFLNCGTEILRIGPVVIGFIRSKIGPNLTQKERDSVWLGLSPLSAPCELEYAALLSSLIVYYMVLFVYSCIAPFTSYIMVFAYFLLSLTYRNQIIYIYSSSNDTGGQLWTRMVRLIIACMIISEITLIGIVSLKKGIVAGPLLFPVLIGTILFSSYINQQHYLVTEHLPSTDCAIRDTHDAANQIDFSFVRGRYIQPELQNKEIFPENNLEVSIEEVVYSEMDATES